MASIAGHAKLKATLVDVNAKALQQSAGQGDALEKAKEDKRPVVKIVWNKNSNMVGATAKSWGGFHSLLTVTVRGEDNDEHQYVIEKVQRTEPTKGVIVSHWKDVVTFIWEPAHRELGEEDVAQANRCTMGDLIALAIGDDQQEYDVSNCNCHHMARLLFNHCAPVGKKVRSLPNMTIAKVAGIFGFGGSNQTGNASGACAEASCAEVPRPLLNMDANCIPNHSAALTARLSYWIYNAQNDLWRIPDIEVRWTYGNIGWLAEQNPGRYSKWQSIEATIADFKIFKIQHQEIVSVTTYSRLKSGNKTAHRQDHKSMKDAIQWLSNTALQWHRDAGDFKLEYNETLSDVGFSVMHLQLEDGMSPLQFAVVLHEEEDVAYIVFRGTKTVLDMVIDIDCKPYECPSGSTGGLQVHSSMWSSLHSGGKSDAIKQIEIRIQEMLTKSPRLDLRYRLTQLLTVSSSNVSRSETYRLPFLTNLTSAA
jgi:hypothetical protein